MLIGKSDIVESVMVCFLVCGYLLFDDFLGFGKMILVKVVVKVVGGYFVWV